MSRFDADIAAGVVDNHLYQFGRTGVRYISDFADPVELTAIPSDERIEERPLEGGGTVAEYVRTETFSTNPDSQYGGVAAPKLGHKLEIDGVNWTIVDPIIIGANMATVTVTRPVPTDVGREGYRSNT